MARVAQGANEIPARREFTLHPHGASVPAVAPALLCFRKLLRAGTASKETAGSAEPRRGSASVRDDTPDTAAGTTSSSFLGAGMRQFPPDGEKYQRLRRKNYLARSCFVDLCS